MVFLLPIGKNTKGQDSLITGIEIYYFDLNDSVNVNSYYFDGITLKSHHLTPDKKEWVVFYKSDTISDIFNFLYNVNWEKIDDFNTRCNPRCQTCIQDFKNYSITVHYINNKVKSEIIPSYEASAYFTMGQKVVEVLNFIRKNYP